MARTWTTPQTWADGSYPGATEFNREIRDNLDYLSQPSSVNLYMTTNQTGIPAATATAAIWGTVEGTDVDSIWTAGTPTRLTIPAGWDGLWDLRANLVCTGGASANESRLLGSIRVNGTTIIQNFGVIGKGSVGNISVGLSRRYRLSAADYIEFLINISADYTALSSGTGGSTCSALWCSV